MTSPKTFVKIHLVLAGIAHLVERHLAKVEVASSSLVARSKEILILLDEDFFFTEFLVKVLGTLSPPVNTRSMSFNLAVYPGFLPIAASRWQNAGKRIRASLHAPNRKIPIDMDGDFAFI